MAGWTNIASSAAGASCEGSSVSVWQTLSFDCEYAIDSYLLAVRSWVPGSGDAAPWMKVSVVAVALILVNMCYFFIRGLCDCFIWYIVVVFAVWHDAGIVNLLKRHICDQNISIIHYTFYFRGPRCTHTPPPPPPPPPPHIPTKLCFSEPQSVHNKKWDVNSKNNSSSLDIVDYVSPIIFVAAINGYIWHLSWIFMFFVEE